MHLMSCEHPKRVYNKYMDQYIWVPCNECNSCKNRRAKIFADACERERMASAFTMFVTLTYDELSLPVCTLSGGFDDLKLLESVDLSAKHDLLSQFSLKSSRWHDVFCIPLSSLDFEEQADKDLFMYYLKNQGIPYASKSDIQLFHKRLNKWFFQNVTNKYQNFRYFLVSELGSTTLRPHFHALYFVNDAKVAERFNEAILSCWKFGRTDCQYVENSASSYVAQYIVKLSDLPSFYKASKIRPFYLASRNPFIGAFDKFAESDEEIFNGATVQTTGYSKKFARPVVTQLDKSAENRLFPKCPFFSEVSDSMRVELYSVVCRFVSKGFREFRSKVERWLKCIYDCRGCAFALKASYFSDFMYHYIDGFSETGENWLRRLYYLSRKVYLNSLRFKVSISHYVRKIKEYYNNKELYLLKLFYEFQEEYVKTNDCFDLQLMYPEYLHTNGFTIGDVLQMYEPEDVRVQRKDSAWIAYSSKQTHFKNMYLDSLKEKNNSFYVQLKRYYYAKKRNEITEALAS